MAKTPGIRRYKQGFRVQISYTDDHGQRHRPSFYFPHDDTPAGWAKAEVERARLIQEHIVDRPTVNKPEAGTVADVIGRWLRQTRRDLQPKTIDVYELAISRILPRIGTMPASKVTGPVLDDLYTVLLESGSKKGGPLSASTVRHCYVVLSAAFTFAERRGEIDRNPVRASRPPRKERSPIVMPTRGDVLDMLDNVDGPAWREALLRLGVASGSRRGELLGVRWSDIDYDKSTVMRRYSVTESSQGVGIREGSKTGKALSPVTIDEPTALALRRVQRLQKEAALAAGVPLVDDPWLFCRSDTPDGSVVMPPGVAKSWWRRFRVKHPQIAGVQWKNLRNFVITQSLAGGVDPFMVAQRAGHRDASMIMKVYAQYLPAADQAAADVMAKVLTR